MKINNKKELIQKLTISLIGLLLGLILYILFGNKIFEMDIQIFKVNNLLTRLLRNYFFDFIWAFSFYIIGSYIIKKSSEHYKLLTGLYVILIGILYEILQLFKIVKGIFDVFDIIIYIFAVFVAYLIERKLWR